MTTVTLSRRRRIVTIVLSGLVVVSACGAETTSDAAVNSLVDSTVATAAPSAEQADSWTSPLVGGGTFSFANARAKGPFGFWFWAPG